MNEPTKKSFWELEDPIRAETEQGIVAYYPKAKRFQLSRLPWTNDKGEECRGKTVTLYVGGIIDNADTIAVFERVLADLKGA